MATDPRAPIPTSYFSVVIARNKEGKFLAVLEINDRGWWLPAGRLEPGETFVEAAIRETEEEAGIKVELKGILRVEHTPGKTHQRMRVVFYAEPVDENAPLKVYSLYIGVICQSVADKESIRAEWMTLEQVKSYEFKPPGLRGDELVQWASYLQSGGEIYPLTLLDIEIAPAPIPKGSSNNNTSTPKKGRFFGFG